ncbi:DUF4148 domain-containing protein, partial [Mitsuaria sp. TWR114]
MASARVDGRGGRIRACAAGQARRRDILCEGMRRAERGSRTRRPGKGRDETQVWEGPPLGRIGRRAALWSDRSHRGDGVPGPGAPRSAVPSAVRRTGWRARAAGQPRSKEFQMNPSPMTFRPRFQPQRLVLALTFGGALLAGLMSVAFAGEPAAAAPVTRAQVEQDLAAYQQSGLAALERDDSQSQVGTAAWREARRRYLALRGLP